jgi:hypothetical protein
MDLIPVILIVLLLAAIIWFVAKKNRQNAAEAEAEDARLEAEIAAEEAELARLEEVEAAAPVKGTDHLAPKTHAKQDALDDNAWRRSHGYAENDTPSQDELDRRDATNTPKIPKPPVNNTYYGQQPRIARQDDSVIRTQNDANTAFLALIAAQQAQEAAEAAKAEHPANNPNGPSEDPATPEPSTDTPAEVEEAVIHAPAEDTTVEDDGSWKDVSEEKYVPADPERNTFDYDSSDNASTYNSTTDNGSDSGSSSSSSYGSSDSSSSSSNDSGSSSSSDGGSSSSD